MGTLQEAVRRWSLEAGVRWESRSWGGKTVKGEERDKKKEEEEEEEEEAAEAGDKYPKKQWSSSSSSEFSDPAGRWAKPKRSEAVVRRLWAWAHQVMEPRTVGSVLQSWSPSFRECVVAYELKEKRVALTIDDAPSRPELMAATLEILQSYDVKATFFAVESFARISAERLDSLRRCVTEGHELGNHLVYDKSSAGLSPAEFDQALDQCEALIESVDPGFSSDDDAKKRRRKWFRPPHGYMSAHMCRTLKQRRYTAALADVFPLDTEVRSVDWIVDFVVSHVKPGSIVLLHAPDLRVAAKTHRRQNNVAVLARLLPTLLGLGFQIGTLSQLADAADREHSLPLAFPVASPPSDLVPLPPPTGTTTLGAEPTTTTTTLGGEPPPPPADSCYDSTYPVVPLEGGQQRPREEVVPPGQQQHPASSSSSSSNSPQHSSSSAVLAPPPLHQSSLPSSPSPLSYSSSSSLDV